MEEQVSNISVPSVSGCGYRAGESFAFIDIDDVLLGSAGAGLEKKHRVDCDSMICCCIGGSLLLDINGQHCRIRAGMFCILKRGDVYYSVQYSHDLHILCILSQNNDYLVQANNTLLLLDFKFRTEQNPCYRFRESTFGELLNLFRLMKSAIRRENVLFKNEIIQDYLRIIFCTICLETVPGTGCENTGRYAGEVLKRFLVLVGTHFRTERKVAFYAEQLCLTSKYLTVLVKKASGRSARQWIVAFVIAESKRLLQNNRLNVLEVCYALNFPNHSFFTKFFHAYTGMTPSEYRDFINA